MTAFESVWGMAETMSPRQLVGAVIKQASEIHGWGPTKVAKAAGIAVNTWYRALAAEPSVSRLSLRQIERGLELPDELLLLIADGAAEDVAALPVEEWPSQRMRRFVLAEMGWNPPPTRRTRKSA